MDHHFDIDIATKYWIEEAIIINNLIYWITKNKANNTNCYDWYYWTYNSTKAFAEIFPYMSSKKISRILLDLEKTWVIKSWNYNTVKYDQTKWYTISQKEIFDCSFLSNGVLNTVQPIPDNNTYIKQDTNNDIWFVELNNITKKNNVIVELNNIKEKETLSSCSIKKEKNKIKKEEIENREKVFESLWDWYCDQNTKKQTEKKKAKTYFDKLIKTKYDLDLLRYAVPRYIASVTNKQYIVLLRTYLSNESYLDYKSEFDKLNNKEEHKEEIINNTNEVSQDFELTYKRSYNN